MMRCAGRRGERRDRGNGRCRKCAGPASAPEPGLRDKSLRGPRWVGMHEGKKTLHRKRPAPPCQVLSWWRAQRVLRHCLCGRGWPGWWLLNGGQRLERARKAAALGANASAVQGSRAQWRWPERPGGTWVDWARTRAGGSAHQSALSRRRHRADRSGPAAAAGIG